MNEDFVKNIEAYYQYAERIAPGYGKDIVHHICTEIPNNVRNINAYVHTSIRNAWRNQKSSFNRLYQPHYSNETTEIQDFDHDGKKYDAILLHRIFLELEMEGYSLEVSVFKDCYLGGSVSSFSQKTKINRRTIIKICNFTQNEIIRRYKQLDND